MTPIKHPLLSTLICACSLVISSGYGQKNNATSCIESATITAGYYLNHIQTLYNEGKDDSLLDDASSSFDGFTKGIDDSSTKRGLVYIKFGQEIGNDYIVTAYFGLGCGVANNSKLMCHLKKDGVNWGSDSIPSPPNPPDPPTGFSMECQLCYDVKLNSSGTEVDAPAPDTMKESVFATIAEGTSDAINNANHYGLILSLTTSDWNVTPACQTVTN